MIVFGVYFLVKGSEIEMIGVSIFSHSYFLHLAFLALTLQA